MGRKKTAKPTKSDKPSSAVQEQQAGHPCPDWAAMQAYYGPGVTMPPPYFNATVPPGQMPPYMWGPQMMPPFAPPYPGIYPHGGVYSHPALPPGSAYPTTSEAVVVTTPTSTGALAKSSNSKKKLKGSDGLAVSTGSGNTENTDGETDGSQSEENGEEDSSDESDWNSEPGGSKTNKKRGSGEAQTSDLTGKAVCKVPIPRTDSRKASNAATPPPATALELREARREKRMRSNRESARRSRMKKQAATEAVAQTAKNLEVENINLKSEIAQLKENSERLRLENSSLMEKLKDPQLGQPEELTPGRTDIESDPSAVVENLLSRIDDSISTMMGQKDDAHHENSMIHQLMDSSPRTDAVAAS